VKSEKPQVTFKTACKLKDAFNQSKKRANQNATLRSHKAQLNDLQSTHHRDPTTNRSFLPGFETPNEPTRMRPVSTFDNASTQTDLPALREDSERINNGPSDAENSLLTQNKMHLYKAKKISQGKQV
jgi:hypothetical protein